MSPPTFQTALVYKLQHPAHKLPGTTRYEHHRAGDSHTLVLYRKLYLLNDFLLATLKISWRPRDIRPCDSNYIRIMNSHVTCYKHIYCLAKVAI
jgi:hypothetical protein